MSEQDNVRRIGQIYEPFGKGEIGYIIDQLTDDVRWVSRFEPIVPWGGDFSGKTNVPKFFEAIATSVDVTAFALPLFTREAARPPSPEPITIASGRSMVRLA